MIVVIGNHDVFIQGSTTYRANSHGCNGTSNGLDEHLNTLPPTSCTYYMTMGLN